MPNLNKLFEYQEDYFKRLNNLRFAWGSIDKTDFMELSKLLNKNKKRGMRIAEIGCWVGVSTVALATVAKSVKGKVFAIDWFKSNAESTIENTGYYYNIKNIFEENIREQKVDEHIKIIPKTSIEASMSFPDNYFDFIFIDADHRYSMFKQDLIAWYPKVKVGGIIAGHDCDVPLKDYFDLGQKYKEKDCILIHVGIIQALKEQFGNNVSIAGNSKIWYKRK